MNTMQLGDYRGGRDSITGLMGGQIPQLQNINQAALTFGSIGLQAMAQKHAMEQKYDLDLRNRMMLANQSLSNQMGVAENNYLHANAAAADKQKALFEFEDDAMSGQEAAMTDWVNNVLSLYEPDSPEAKQVIRTLDMIKKRPKGSTAFNKGYLSFITDRNINDPMSQGSAGAAGWREAKKPVPSDRAKAPTKKVPGYEIDNDLDSP